MSRVINFENPTKLRNNRRRTIAELLRRLSRKPAIDEETKDMAAAIVFALSDISDGVEQTIRAWEKRDYWLKAERFLRQWEWTTEAAVNIDDVIRHEAWDLLPGLLIDLNVHFTDIQIKTMTRKPEVWQGAYQKLLNEPPRELPW